LSAGGASSQAVAIAKTCCTWPTSRSSTAKDLAVAQELDGLLGIAVGQLIMEWPATGQSS
jgi:hypothetical protein